MYTILWIFLISHCRLVQEIITANYCKLFAVIITANYRNCLHSQLFWWGKFLLNYEICGLKCVFSK